MMIIDVLSNVKLTVGDKIHRFKAGRHDVQKAVGDVLVKEGLAVEVKGAKLPANTDDKKPDDEAAK